MRRRRVLLLLLLVPVFHSTTSSLDDGPVVSRKASFRKITRAMVLLMTWCLSILFFPFGYYKVFSRVSTIK